MELRTKMHVLTLRFIMICGRKQSLIPEQKGKKKEKKRKKQEGICLEQLS